MPARLTLVNDPAELQGLDAHLYIGRPARLQATDVLDLLPNGMPQEAWRSMVKRTDPGDHGRVAVHWTGGKPARIAAGLLPEVCSRHNAPSRAWAIPNVVNGGGQKGNVAIVLALSDADHALASVLAVARALPTFTAVGTPVDREAKVLVLGPDGPVANVAPLAEAAYATRLAAHLTDQPPDVLDCDGFVRRAEQVAEQVGASIHVLRTEALREQGLLGVHSVGRAANTEPALVVLDHSPPGADPAAAVAWVGKGIVYDTGGLSLKSKTGMPGMKADMAGAAAVLGAFRAAAKLGVQRRITAILCIAENAIGPNAIRPDDIIRMYSGRSVEVNNTDAEGRLVLADGVAWAARNRNPSIIVDLATLTGAQAVATGKRHAAAYCSDEELELRAVTAGRRVGELVHPLPFAPEFFRREFQSVVADMRNSVKDRSNAQSSCAAQFIGNHLAATGYDRPWLHIDMVGPSMSSHRGTGFGVGLLLSLFDVL